MHEWIHKWIRAQGRQGRSTKAKRESQEGAVKIKYITPHFRDKDGFQICLNTAKHRRTKYIHYPAAEYRVKKRHMRNEVK